MQIRCQHGPESVREALAEIEAMRRFRGPHTLPLVDAAVVQDDGRGASLILGQVPAHDEESLRTSKLVYLVLPYMPRGHLQDEIHAHAVRGTRFDEARMLRLFLGACEGVRALHRYTLPHVSVEAPDVTRDDTALLFDAEAYPMAAPMQARSTDGAGEEVPYAHRDIKPAYVALLTQQPATCGGWRVGAAHGLWEHDSRACADPYAPRCRRRAGRRGGAL